jgi:thymidylate kinase
MIGIVGPCSAGKTTLIRNLDKQGIQARHIAQEHSYVPDMWKQIANPGLLIYLDVSYEVSMQRRKLDMTKMEFEQLVERLSHARVHAHLYIDTENISPEEVVARVFSFLDQNSQNAQSS